MGGEGRRMLEFERRDKKREEKVLRKRIKMDFRSGCGEDFLYYEDKHLSSVWLLVTAVVTAETKHSIMTYNYIFPSTCD